MTERTRTAQIVISDREPGLPFSKGLLASQVMVTGLSPYRSYQVAEEVEIRLLERRHASVTSAELADTAIEVIRELASERYATNYVRWRQIEDLDVPLVILIGGATGVGKSTIATQLAARLGIVRVIATDAIREVMRAMLSAEMIPTLHVSSFQADSALREPPTKTADALTLGFREQTAAVSVGINALIDRAADDGTSIVIEGAHVVPGFFETEAHASRILAVPFVIAVDEEERHRSHFAAREGEERGRLATRYVEGFEGIRRLQRYVRSQALAHGIPVIPNYSFDQSIAAVIDLVMERASERAAAAATHDRPSAAAPGPDERRPDGRRARQEEGTTA